MKTYYGAILGLVLVACGGGGGSTPAPSASESASVLTLSATPYWPEEFKGIATTDLNADVQLLASSSAKALTSSVSATASSKVWEWQLPAVPDGDYGVQLTIRRKAVPLATAEISVQTSGQQAQFELARGHFSNVGGGDADGDTLSNLQEVRLGTDPEKGDTDGDGLSDGAETQTNPLKVDTDGDSVNDKEDAFPLDSNESVDSDKDGVGNAKDNCAQLPNADQKNGDHDAQGDVCDGSDDNDPDQDGLSNSAEALLKTNPALADTDADTVLDGSDAFPLDPTEVADGDADGVGDMKDNCAKNKNPSQTNTDKWLKDKGVLVEADGKGDDCDDDPDGDGRNVVYVDGKNGNDGATGYYTQPVKSITKGMQLAAPIAASVWVAAGDYEVGAVTWLKGSKFLGGFTSTFDPKVRDVRDATAVHRTRLLASKKANTLVLKDITSDIQFDGFHIESDSFVAVDASAVLIDNSVVTLARCTVTGNGKADFAKAVQIQSTAVVSLSANEFRAGGYGVESVGVFSADSVLTMTNSIVKAGSAPHATAVKIKNGLATLANNTLDATNALATQQMAIGVWLIGAAPRMANNLVMVKGQQVEGIYFEKDVTPPAGTQLLNNVIATGGEPNPLVRDYQGVAYTAVSNGDLKASFSDGSTQLLTSILGSVSGNATASVALPLGMVTASYVPLSGSVGVDAGVTTSAAEWGSVVTDWNGVARAGKGGAYDVGAIEY